MLNQISKLGVALDRAELVTINGGQGYIPCGDNNHHFDNPNCQERKKDRKNGDA